MYQSQYLLPLAAVLSQLCGFANAQTEQILSVVVVNHHGERTPRLTDTYPNLTPLGAQQSWQAGVRMRERYVKPVGLYERSFAVRDISSIILKPEQINILSASDAWIAASAQAFMQGLYPPLTEDQNYTKIFGESDLANGTNIVAPLGGYQYPNIQAASTSDQQSIYVQGSVNCPAYKDAMDRYYVSADYNTSAAQTQPLYDRLKDSVMKDILPDVNINYRRAYSIWDYLRYGLVHNTTVARRLSAEDATAARLLAAKWMFEMYANSTSDGKVGKEHIRAIAGRTMARFIWQSLYDSIVDEGRTKKVNLAFTDYRSMISFAALANLMTQQTGAFYTPPAPGASMVFELLSRQSASANVNYPKATDMYVRFYYMSGNDTSSRLIEYSLFGRSPSQAMMSWAEFTDAMSGIKISDAQDWCQTCGSFSNFCASAAQDTASSRHSLKPAVAGVIGAIAALAFIALVLGLVMALGGIRFYRRSRKSEMGGYKGNEKLRSDQDLTLPKGGATVVVSEEPRGHERVGSWELKDSGKVQNMHSGIDTAAFGRTKHDLDHDDTVVDPYATPTRPRDAF